MPKVNIGNVQELIEQHVEKGVVALCAIFLIVAVGHWVISSPRTTELYTGATLENVAPADADAAVLQAARRVKQRADDAQFSRPPSPDYLGVIKTRRGDPFRVGTTDGVPVRLDTSGFMALLPPPAPREIATVVMGEYFSPDALAQSMKNVLPDGQLPAPRAWAGRTLYRDGQQVRDAIVAHVVTSFPLGALQKEWDETLKKAHTGIRVVVAAVEVDSQFRSPGGEWSANSAELAATPVIIDDAPTAPPTVPEYDGANAQAVLQAVADLSETWQGHLLRPGYWEALDATSGDLSAWSAVFPDGVDADDANAVWFHDESLRPTLEYRYRYRLRLVNPLLASERDVHPDFPDHAGQRFIDTEWSPWSQAVGVKGSTEFFLSGANSAKNSVNVTVVTLAKGQPVEAEFQVKPGQAIGGPLAVTVTINQQSETETVDFTTGAVLVGIDFDSHVYRGVTRLKDTQVLYVDQNGDLQRRSLRLDKAAKPSPTR